MSTRRDFLKTAAAVTLFQAGVSRLALSSPAISAAETSRIPLAFSTLGCPAWEWKKILEFAQQHGFAAIELRGLQGNLDLPSNPIFSANQIEQTKKEIGASGLKIACVSSSANLFWADPAKRDKEL